jgi:hypothetical protein
MVRARLAAFAGIVTLMALFTTTQVGAAQDAILHATLTGSQETPPNASTATGRATVFVDADTNNICVFLSFSGLNAPATAAHIHVGPPGVAGPVVFPITVPPATSGSVFYCAASNATTVNGISTNPTGYYVNVHDTPNFPGGEIRGQLSPGF